MKNNKVQQQEKYKSLIDKKPLTSSITITALEDHENKYVKDHFKKNSMMSPRFSELPEGQYHRRPLNKQSSVYQYEIEHNQFPLPNDFIIT